MQAGLYRTKVVIQQKTITQDEIGNEISTWANYKTCWCYANGLSGREYWEAAVIHQENTVEFVFRWHPYLDQVNTTEYRILFNNQIYNINLIDNIQFKNKTVKMKATVKYDKEGQE